MEIWDLYTENRVCSGKTHVRGEELPDDLYHLVVHGWIVNHKGDFLISQRSANRPSFPLMWECVGGSVLAGESSLDGILREIQEEVGLCLTSSAGMLVDSVCRKYIAGKKFNDILDIWLFRYDGDIFLENATTDEVAQIRWMTPSEIQALLCSGELVDTLSYFFEKIVPLTKGNEYDLS